MKSKAKDVVFARRALFVRVDDTLYEEVGRVRKNSSSRRARAGVAA